MLMGSGAGEQGWMETRHSLQDEMTHVADSTEVVVAAVRELTLAPTTQLNLHAGRQSLQKTILVLYCLSSNWPPLDPTQNPFHI